jgi:hypothetical protein
MHSRRRIPYRRSGIIAALAGLLLACGAAAVLVSAVLAASAGAAPSHRARIASSVTVGISDNSASMFADPRLRWLGVHVARLVLPWDVVHRRSELGWDSAWLSAARAHGVRPLVAFNADPSHPHLLPSTAQYGAAIRAFMAMFPWVHDFSPWNEENHPLQPTSTNPRRAAEYFNLLSARCPACSVTAADVLDTSNMAPWLHGFLRYAHHPRLWGLHNYVDLWRGTDENTALLLRTVPGQVWFTEIGAVVWRWERPYGRHSASYIVRPESEAATVASRLAGLAAVSPRITRVYYYQWRVPHTLQWARVHHQLSWDSGLIRPDCSARPAFSVLAGMLGRDPARVPHVRLNRAGNCV